MDKFAELLKTLADKLGCGVDKIYSILMKQVHVQILQDYLLIGIFLVITATLVYWIFCLKKHIDECFEKSNGKNCDGSIFFLVLCFIGVICFIVAIIYNANEIVILHYNPEYWALQEIFKSLK